MPLEMTPTRKLTLLSGRAHPELADGIAKELGCDVTEANLRTFPNSEVHCRFGESVRGSDVFVVQSHAAPTNDSIMEQAIMIDAAKRGSAKRITAVCPYYGYSRQDRKASGREPITARLVADILRTAGAERIVSIELHSGQIQGFFDGPFDHLVSLPVLTDYLQANAPENMVLVSPDIGGAKMIERLARHVNADVAIVDKRRDTTKLASVEAKGVLGSVKGRACVLVDDEISTAGTITAAADLLIAEGASEVWAMATHGVLADPGVDRLKNAPIERVVLTDTLPLPAEKRIDKIEIVSVAGLLARAIDAVFQDTSVSEIFWGENQR